jgi:DNA-binding transcriptional ArsR family regulator
MDEYIKISSEKALKESRERLLHGKGVFIKDPLPEEVNIDYVLGYIEKHIPRQLMHLVDFLYVGDFPFLKQKDINATYENGAIYVTNEQRDEDDMIDDIVHELAHSVEELHGDVLYGDGLIEKEFLGKRSRFCSLLSSEGLDIPRNMCYNVDYDKKFDEILYKTVGYEKMISITMGLFISPYGVTSLREYFANGFESYFIGDRRELETTSPGIYKKIEGLFNNKIEEL